MLLLSPVAPLDHEPSASWAPAIGATVAILVVVPLTLVVMVFVPPFADLAFRAKAGAIVVKFGLLGVFAVAVILLVTQSYARASRHWQRRSDTVAAMLLAVEHASP
jgi:uncharacterized BrkB/YihY/UPF0761 family membrane protein